MHGRMMAAVSCGARSSKRWTGGEVTGIIPRNDPADANCHVDVVIPTGLGLARNILVARTVDACIGARGASGTLSEIAFAWHLASRWL